MPLNLGAAALASAGRTVQAIKQKQQQQNASNKRYDWKPSEKWSYTQQYYKSGLTQPQFANMNPVAIWRDNKKVLRKITDSHLRNWCGQYPKDSPQPDDDQAPKRGRHLMLDPPEIIYVETVVDQMRANYLRVTSATVCEAARAAIDFFRSKDFLETTANESNSTYKLSAGWAANFMKERGYGVYAKSGDRTVTDEEIEAAAKLWFPQVRVACSNVFNRRLVFNMDEFAVHLDHHGTWTWHRKSVSKNVAIHGSKVQFTCSILTNAAGERLLLQIIWKGGTHRVHVSGHVSEFAKKYLPNVEIYEDHRSDSHFQNGETFDRWKAKFIEIVDKIRGENNNEPAVLFLDSATQHFSKSGGEPETEAELEPELEPENQNQNQNPNPQRNANEDSMLRCFRDLVAKFITVLKIPPKMTHIFQPADMFIIANFKSLLRGLWDRHVARQISRETEETRRQKAISNFLSSSVPVQRTRKFIMIVQALGAVSEQAVQKSWIVSHLLRLFPNLQVEREYRRKIDSETTHYDRVKSNIDKKKVVDVDATNNEDVVKIEAVDDVEDADDDVLMIAQEAVDEGTKELLNDVKQHQKEQQEELQKQADEGDALIEAMAAEARDKKKQNQDQRQEEKQQQQQEQEKKKQVQKKAAVQIAESAAEQNEKQKNQPNKKVETARAEMAAGKGAQSITSFFKPVSQAALLQQQNTQLGELKNNAKLNEKQPKKPRRPGSGRPKKVITAAAVGVDDINNEADTQFEAVEDVEDDEEFDATTQNESGNQNQKVTPFRRQRSEDARDWIEDYYSGDYDVKAISSKDENDRTPKENFMMEQYWAETKAEDDYLNKVDDK